MAAYVYIMMLLSNIRYWLSFLRMALYIVLCVIHNPEFVINMCQCYHSRHLWTTFPQHWPHFKAACWLPWVDCFVSMTLARRRC